jgi:hypothetical protein
MVPRLVRMQLEMPYLPLVAPTAPRHNRHCELRFKKAYHLLVSNQQMTQQGSWSINCDILRARQAESPPLCESEFVPTKAFL